MDEAGVLSHFEKVSRSGAGYVGICPAHDDKQKSLSVTFADDGKTLLHCFAGCDFEHIRDAAGLTKEDCQSRNGNGSRPEIVAAYDYTDKDGRVLYQAVRFVPKDFRPRLPSGEWGLRGEPRRVLYRLPEVLEAAANDETIYVVEGEKDVETLRGLGLVATTGVGGAKNWRAEYGETLRGCNVVVLPDKDAAGEEYAAAILRSLEGKTDRVTVVRLPGLSDHGDVTDWIVAGGTKEQLAELVTPKPDEGAWMTVEEAFDSAGATGPRRPLGFPEMDKQLEGGLYAGTVTTCQGKPGIGKTMYLTQAALHLAKTCAVACLFADEGVRGALVTLGQQMGVARQDLLAREPSELRRAIDLLNDQRPFFRLLRPSHPRAAIESFFEDFLRLAPPGMPRVVLIDSGQRVRMKDSKQRETVFEAIGRRFEFIRDTSVDNAIVALVTSQVNRGQYRKPSDLDDPMAGGYGNAAIEYCSELLLNLDGNPTKANPRVRLRAVKNRISAEGTFEIPLLMDYPRKAFLEIDPVATEGEVDPLQVKRQAELEAEIDKILKAVPDGYLTGTIKTRVTGRAADIVKALNRMVGDGRLVMDELPRGGQRWKRSLGR